MKIHHASVFVILTLFAGHSARAADWEVVRSPNGGTQANSFSSVAAATDSDVWAVGWAFNQSLVAYRTLTEHWNGTRWWNIGTEWRGASFPVRMSPAVATSWKQFRWCRLMTSGRLVTHPIATLIIIRSRSIGTAPRGALYLARGLTTIFSSGWRRSRQTMSGP